MRTATADPSFSVMVDGTEWPFAGVQRIWKRLDGPGEMSLRIPQAEPHGQEYAEFVRPGLRADAALNVGRSEHMVFRGAVPPKGLQIPSVGTQRAVMLNVQDYLGLLSVYPVMLRDSTSTATVLTGEEIGGAIMQVVASASTAIVTAGIQGSAPRRFVQDADGLTGLDAALGWVGKLNELAVAKDDLDSLIRPRRYHFSMRGGSLMWRKEPKDTDPPAMMLELGTDAILSGNIASRAVTGYAVATSENVSVEMSHRDADTERRWKKGPAAQVDSTAEYTDELQEDAVFEVERAKLMRRSIRLKARWTALYLEPGDLVDIIGGDRWGVPDGNYIIHEMEIATDPVITVELILGERYPSLVDYL